MDEEPGSLNKDPFGCYEIYQNIFLAFLRLKYGSHVGNENGDCWGRILGTHTVLEWLCGQRLTKNVSFVSSARDF